MTVVTANNPPVIAAIGNKTVTEEQQLTFAVTASDVDGDAVVLSVQGLPAGAVFSNDQFAWTPAKGQAGTYTVTFTASDGKAQDTETVTITVNAAVVVPTGLVASWTFDEGSGTTVLDTTGNGNNGTLDGATWTTGVTGSAVDLNGTSAKVVIADKSGFSPQGSFTVSAWINPRSFGGSGYGRIFDKGDASSGFSFYLYESNQALSYAIYGGKTARSKNNVIAMDKWQHVVMAYDNATGFVTFYVDGINVGTGNVGSSPADCTGKNGYIGIRGYDLSRAFNGVVDNVKVFNRALSAQEIAQLK